MWTEQSKITANYGVYFDEFGSSVSLSGNTAVIGASRSRGSALSSGSAYVYTRQAGVWSEEAKLLACDGTLGDEFGSSVSVSGDIAVIGTNDGERPSDAGNQTL